MDIDKNINQGSTPIIRKPTIVHVDNSSNPSSKDSVFNNAQDSFFEKYKIFLIAATLFIIILISVYLYFFSSNEPVIDNNITNNNPSLDGGTGVIKNPNNTSTTTNNALNGEGDYTEVQKKLLVKLWSRAISGQDIIYSGSGTTTAIGIAWVDKLTGNVYKAFEPDWKPLRVTNTTISNTVNAVFLNNGNTVVMQQYNQSKNTISTIIADIPRTNEGSGDALENMSNLSENIKSITSSTDGTSLYMVTATDKGSAIYQMDSTEKKPVIITTTTLSDLEIKYIDSNTLLVYQKPAATLKTSAYTLNVKNKQLNLKYNDYGLTAIGNNSKYLYSTTNSTYTDVSGQKVKRYTNTVAGDKCKISSSSSYAICANPKDVISNNMPDDWYDYSYYTNDDLVLYGLDYEESNTLLDLSIASGAAFDVDNVSISNNSEYVGLSNRYGSLYVFNLGGVSN